MKEIEQIANSFGVSEPKFEGIVEYDGSTISFSVKNPYKPSPKDYEDPLSKLVANSYSESFDSQVGAFVRKINCTNIYHNLVSSIGDFFEESSPLKNPKQSRLYKWIRTMEDREHHPASVGFIAMYRYIHNNKIVGGYKNNPHTQNVLAILELMRDKYEEE